MSDPQDPSPAPPESAFAVCGETDPPDRLDRFLATRFSDYSRSFLQKLILNGNVQVNQTVCESCRWTIRPGDTVSVMLPAPANPVLIGEDIPLPILFEDERILVIDKPAGMVVHPAAGAMHGTVVHALLARYESFSDPIWQETTDGAFRPGIVHRLDRDTSGCLIVAKDPKTHFAMGRLFHDRAVRKEYAAITYGVPRHPVGEIDRRIGRHPTNRKKMAILDCGGRDALTRYRLLSCSKKVSGHPAIGLLSVQIMTGRTHQIRVHLTSVQAPVLGDAVYGGKQSVPAPRQMLHAWKIEFPHPGSGNVISLASPFPEDFRDTLETHGIPLPVEKTRDH
jgi:23S rRNA pseudouridine1911/1915/1917 synthase